MSGHTDASEMTASGSSLPVTASQDEAAYALLNTTIETRALGTLQLVKILGMGSFAVVFEGVALGNPSVKYAVKTLFKQALTPQQLAVQTLESTYHAQLSTPPHPNIVTLFEAIHTEDHLFLVLEFCDDDLFGLIEKRDGLSPKEAKIVMRQLVNGLRYIHSRGVYHRDLKPENVLVKYPSSYRSSSEHVVVKFTDFGLSTTERFTTEFGVGSVRYMAPEVLTPSDTPYDAEKNDVWALGVLFINLMTTQNPWSEPKHQDMLYKSYEEEGASVFADSFGFVDEACVLLGGCLNVDPEERWDVERLGWELERLTGVFAEDDCLESPARARGTLDVSTPVRGAPRMSYPSPEYESGFEYDDHEFEDDKRSEYGTPMSFAGVYGATPVTPEKETYDYGASWDEDEDMDWADVPVWETPIKGGMWNEERAHGLWNGEGRSDRMAMSPPPGFEGVRLFETQKEVCEDGIFDMDMEEDANAGGLMSPVSTSLPSVSPVNRDTALESASALCVSTPEPQDMDIMDVPPTNASCNLTSDDISTTESEHTATVSKEEKAKSPKRRRKGKKKKTTRMQRVDSPDMSEMATSESAQPSSGLEQDPSAVESTHGPEPSVPGSALSKGEHTGVSEPQECCSVVITPPSTPTAVRRCAPSVNGPRQSTERLIRMAVLRVQCWVGVGGLNLNLNGGERRDGREVGVMLFVGL